MTVNTDSYINDVTVNDKFIEKDENEKEDKVGIEPTTSNENNTLDVINNNNLKDLNENNISGTMNQLQSGNDDIIQSKMDDQDAIDAAIQVEKDTMTAFIIMTSVVVPTFMIFSSFLLGLLLTLTEGWSVWNSFTQVATNLTGSSQDQNGLTPTSFLGVSFDVIISVQVIVLQTIVGTVVSIGSFLKSDSDLSDTQGLIFIFAAVPTALLTLGFASGGIMSLIEANMDFMQGFKFSISNICGLGNPLTNSQPNTAFGIIFSLVISCQTFVALGIILGIAGSLPLFEDFMNNFESLFVQMKSHAKKHIDDAKKQIDKNLNNNVELE